MCIILSQSVVFPRNYSSTKCFITTKYSSVPQINIYFTTKCKINHIVLQFIKECSNHKHYHDSLLDSVSYSKELR